MPAYSIEPTAVIVVTKADLDTLERSLGPDHPFTKRVREALATAKATVFQTSV